MVTRGTTALAVGAGIGGALVAGGLAWWQANWVHSANQDRLDAAVASCHLPDSRELDTLPAGCGPFATTFQQNIHRDGQVTYVNLNQEELRTRVHAAFGDDSEYRDNRIGFPLVAGSFAGVVYFVTVEHSLRRSREQGEQPPAGVAPALTVHGAEG